MNCKNVLVMLLLSAACMSPGADAATSPDCNSLDACMKLMAQPANPPATYPYGLSAYDLALVKKVLSYGPKANPGLIKLLKDTHIDVYQRAGDALEDTQGLTNADLPALVEAAKNGNSAVPGALAVVGTPEAIRALLDLVRDNPQVASASQISWGLQRLKWKSLPYLVAELRCKGACNEEYLNSIESILGDMPKGVKPQGSDLAAIVADKSLSMYSRDAALRAIGDFKIADPDVIKVVAQAAAEPDLRDDAVETLVDTQSREAVRYLVIELHESGSGAAGTLYSIAALGDAGLDGGAEVVPYLQSPDWESRVEAAAALGSIGYRPAIPALVAALHGPDWRVSYEAARGLGLMHAKEARSALEDASLHHWFKPVRVEADRALTAIDTDGYMDERENTGPFGRGNGALMIYMSGLPSEDEEESCKSNQVRWQGKDVTIDDVRTWPTQPESPRFALPEYSTGVIEADGGWLVGRDKGEFGGGLYAYDQAGNRTEVLSSMDENIHGIYRLGGALLAVGGLAHMTLDHGRVYRLDEVQGTWKAVPLVELPGAPFKVGVLDDAHLVINAIGGAVSLDGNGQIASLECIQ